MEGQSSFRPSDVAIVFDNTTSTADYFQNAIGGMLKQEYNLETTNIRDHVMNDNTDKVVFGTIEDCMSYEAPCVIYIGIEMGLRDNMYSLLSRARTQLTLIWSSKFPSHPILQQLLQHGTLVTWVEENGHFVKK